ncbi:MAG: histidine--tRNA ligase [Planctomycetes bacterium]|nr:histidine--tRNA ligase [Planctomycetota bacterium]MBL7107073.1 histidine--tRNA ligase [Phycisphaerae bacterium]
MKIPPVKGTRDFYPPQMAVHNFINDGWKRASIRNGFEEYDGPIFEYLKMYQIKSGDEIVDQLFNFKDRGDRHLAIRPEITPTLARMVNQQINALSKPIKWFSVPRLCRAERPQKGRLREFYQWNIDIIGIDDVLADAEIIFTTIDYLRQLGLKPADVKAKISSRKLLAALLCNIGIPEEKLDSLYPLLDKKAKLPADTFEELLKENVCDGAKVKTILDLMSVDSVEKISDIINLNQEAQAALDEIKHLFDLLAVMDIGEYCVFDMSIVRGLAYYTGVVFEVHDMVGDLRAIAGGGRYDNLLRDFGGPAISATGMGMGDCVLEILLRQRGLLKDGQLQTRKVEFFVAYVNDELLKNVLEITARLRQADISTSFSYKAQNLKKQLKQAAALNAEKCIILGDELEQGQIVIKDMSTGEQSCVDMGEFFKNL